MSTDIPFILDALQSSSTVETQVRFPCTKIYALRYFFSMCAAGYLLMWAMRDYLRSGSFTVYKYF